MGYAKLRPRPANGNSPSSVLKPVSPKSYRGLWVGGLLLLVISAATFCLVYIRNSKKDKSAEAYGHSQSQMNDRNGDVMLSDREIRLRSDAKRLKDSGRCDSDNTARAAAEAKEAMRNLFR